MKNEKLYTQKFETQHVGQKLYSQNKNERSDVQLFWQTSMS